MKPSDDLFQLIKSLTKTEKRYFKRFCFLYSTSKKNNYLKLFEAIDKQKEYNEGKIKEKFKNERFITQLSVAKDYLGKIILKSLNLYNSSNYPHVLIKDFIVEAEILIHKKLYLNAWKKIQKVKHLSYEYGYYFYVLEALGDEKVLLQFTKSSSEKIGHLLEEENRVVEEIIRIRRYLNYNTKIMTMIQTCGLPFKKVEDSLVAEKSLNKLMKLNVNDAFSFNAKTIYYHTVIFYNIAVCRYDNAYSNAITLVQIINSNKVNKFYDPTNYYWAMHNLILSKMKLNKIETIESNLETLDEFISKKKYYYTKRNYTEMYLNFYLLEIKYFNLLGYYNKAVKTIESRGLLNQLNNDIKSSELLLFNISITYFLNFEYDKALNLLSNLSKTSSYSNWKSVVDILRLIIYYEIGDIEFCVYLIASMKRELKLLNKISLESQTINLMNKLIKTNDKAEISKLFHEYKINLFLFKDPVNLSIIDDLHLVNWVESKLNKLSKLK